MCIELYDFQRPFTHILFDSIMLLKMLEEEEKHDLTSQMVILSLRGHKSPSAMDEMFLFLSM